MKTISRQQAGCIRFAPVDVCGKNAELTLQSRVKNFKKTMLSDLLYKDRKRRNTRAFIRPLKMCLI